MTLQVGVKIFLRNPEGKFLLLKRSVAYGKTKGSWDIVGGRIEAGTGLIENLRREVLEETKLTITSEPKLLYAQDIFVPSKDLHVVRLSFVGDTTGEPVLDTKENTDYKWLSLEELSKQEDLDVYVKEILDKNLLV
ncbi:MAG: hypothetical protein A2664_02385 [Candidatus Taylorbacteria bacterium RIFCSPHIGHO2_01_FULL_46_22b]|uniref:Nudix hydrolase domain-containing protein n=1 Tax=Candidatus Taylorbacteria bacterium RIFCSPHIGHO2_01_FULL_46_22b TaxID=1802301 RepID=A0A1G2M355_9BACT|nr:MAG: hypothetical protein A2664_02385 [Candidatus Taylorbacteria bacterium RIFCSPHIGHO2_01_FULL_46_22b]